MATDFVEEASGFICRKASLIRLVADEQQLSVQPSNLRFEKSGTLRNR